MNVIRKKKPENSILDLMSQLERWSLLLHSQKEPESAVFLKNLAQKLQAATPQSPALKNILSELENGFTGDHELEAYMIKRKTLSEEWSEAEELYMVSTSVWNLLQRLSKGM
jgi:hypothetical protein